ncbi:MAG TPA: OstA-like protein [Paludibacter sp.]|nr:OstA-like protein [Paludibacter sp.]
MNINKKQNIKISNTIRHIILFGVFCLFIGSLQAQIRHRQLRNQILQSQNPLSKENTKKGAKQKKAKSIVAGKPGSLAPIVNPLENRNATLVYLENAETWMSDPNLNPDIQILRGNVRFRHDNAMLYCDSAYFYQKANSLDAFSNVRIVQGDTLFVYGDLLYYDGNLKLARIRRNVRLENRKTTLTTDSLNFDRNTNFAYYYTGGKIVDPENTLTSIWGQYSTATNAALFRNTVHLVNDKFTLDTDSLRYNTKTSVANLICQTHIVYDKETDIEAKRGWYNTNNEQMMLLDRSVIKQKDGKTIIGDTVFYDKNQNYGEVFSKVILNDTIQKNTLYGNYLYYNDSTEVGIASDSALLMDWSGKDTMYIHADTLFTYKDSIYDVSRGFYNVRFYRNDVQGICDSLVYSTRDSIMNMYKEPVLWSEKNQLSGDFIKATLKNDKVDKIDILDNAMTIQQEDSAYFNQISGKDIIAYVDSGQLKRVEVNGNAETIYFPRDDKDSTLIGTNKTESSYVVMHFKNKKVERIVLTSASSGTMYPLDQLSGDELLLKNFFWIDEQRPKNVKEVLTTFPKKTREKLISASKTGKDAESKDTKKDKNPPKTKSDTL